LIPPRVIGKAPFGSDRGPSSDKLMACNNRSKYDLAHLHFFVEMGVLFNNVIVTLNRIEDSPVLPAHVEDSDKEDTVFS
jgi:hypothetical protein